MYIYADRRKLRRRGRAGSVSSMHRLLVIAAALAVASSPADAATRNDALLVGLRANGAFMAAPALARAGGTEMAPSVGIWRIPASRSSPLLAELRRLGLLRWTQREQPLSAAAGRVVPDPLTPDQWWRVRVGADAAEPPAAGVPVTVIDTGIDLTHPEFSSRPDTIPLNAQRVTDSDKDYHGTAVASVAAAPANGVGLLGIYPSARLQVYDADLQGRVTDAELIRAIDTAAAAGPTVINLSLGSPRFNQALQDVIYSAFRRGSLVVAASGNSRRTGNPLNFPANMAHVLTVGATVPSDTVASFSSTSLGVDLAAPGVEIPVAMPSRFAAGGYGTAEGTSFSAPMVSGATAWVWTARPELDNTQVFDIMRWSARDVGRIGFDEETGYGLLDVPAALARQAPLPDPQEPNDDVHIIRPGPLFLEGTPPLTTTTRKKASLRARVDVSEDPFDIYRVWIAAGRTMTASVRSGSDVDLAVWRPSTPSIYEVGTESKRFRAASSARPGASDSLKFRNTTRRGAYYFLEIHPGRRAGGTSAYSLSVTTK